MTILMKMTRSKLAVIITAAGSSTRLGAGIKKEYLPYKSGTVLSACATVFLTAQCTGMELAAMVVTCPPGGENDTRNALFSDKNFCAAIGATPLQIVAGGTTRQASVFEGLRAVKKICPDTNYVLIHDGARPFVSQKLVRIVAEATAEHKAAVPGITPTDTQKEVDADGFIVRHLARNSLCAVQTPQGFDFLPLYQAHSELSQKNSRDFTDDTEIWAEFYGPVKVVPGEPSNIKITYPADLERL